MMAKLSFYFEKKNHPKAILVVGLREGLTLDRSNTTSFYDNFAMSYFSCPSCAD
jgi:hypothetical protein